MERTAITACRVGAYTVPTDGPESDGTLTWDKTTLVLVELEAGGQTGTGFSYADTVTATVIHDKLKGVVLGSDAFSPGLAWTNMTRVVRNVGRPGIAAMAISAVDTALWDLKARLLNLPLVTLLGQVQEAMPVYGSGGFTSYSEEQLGEQLAGWGVAGIQRVKMKVGREPAQDLKRVRVAREAIGEGVELFVDANGAYTRKQALAQAELFARFNVRWFEEPVSSDDLEGLHLLRDRGPAGMDIAAGEYGYDPVYFRRLLEAGAVDVLQADMTRCGGITGFLGVTRLCETFQIPLSCHTAPALHLAPACATANTVHIEYFHDHVRIEAMLFDGVTVPEEGRLRPDLSRAGHGLTFRHADAQRFLTNV